MLASISLEHNIKWFRVGLELDSITFCSISIAILKVKKNFDHHLALFPGIDHHLAPVSVHTLDDTEITPTGKRRALLVTMCS